jgi:signal transduction histidine kinase
MISRNAATDSPVDRERDILAREEWLRHREHAIAVHDAALRARETWAQPAADVEQLMNRMREANQRLILAAVQAQSLSDEAHAETTQARADLDHLMGLLREANERLASAASRAETLATLARHRQEEYRQLSGRLLTLQDEERRRLALDLHDSTGQRLAALTMNLDIVVEAEGLSAASRRALAESRSLAALCSREVRTLAYLLHPPLLDEAGLRSAVRWYAEGFSKRSGIDVAMDLGDVGRLPGSIERALFRVVQESLTNIHRHAETTTASIRLTAVAKRILLEIRDQGHGLPDRGTRAGGTPRAGTLGVGIQGMRERIRQLDGSFAVAFTGRGTMVRVSVPREGNTV